MEVQLPPSIFSSLQDPPRGVGIKHSFLTEDINVVDTQLPGLTELPKSWDLNIDHVLCSIFCRAASDGETDAFFIAICICCMFSLAS